MTVLALTPTAFAWVPGQAGLDLTPADLTAFPNADTGVTFPNYSGNVILVVYNGMASGTITVQPVAVRTVEQQAVTVPAYTLANLKMQVFGPFPPNDFNVAGVMTVNITASAAGVGVGAFSMVKAPSQL
jgi:hypothetical protein